MSKIVIMGSARNDGDTGALIQEVIKMSQWDLLDLNDYHISQYDYNHNNTDDDYLPLMTKIIENYDTMVFATPVYWYNMSGAMKIFFDRITDLLTIKKEQGRLLRGKKMAAISCSHGDNLGEHFWLPFKETARYLGMKYIGGIHIIAGKTDASALKNFIDIVDQTA